MEDDAKLLEKHGYILDGTLGKGSYGKVKSAYSKELKKKVAIKIIDKTKAPAEFLQKFLPRELEILSSLNHPHIVKTFKIFRIGEKKLFIMMELGAQGDLLELIKTRGKLSEDLARKLFHQLSLAVKFIHDQNIVHRDLKCENLLLDNDFNLKVADFGFSKRLEYIDGQVVLSDTFCGSSAYASPELLQRISYNPKVNDVWSMGVVLFIMLTGTMPYDDSSITKMLENQKKHAINFPKPLQDNCKDAYDLITCMLDRDPVRRIDINHILQHPWLQDESKQAKGTRRKWSGPSTSQACAENAEHNKKAKKALSDDNPTSDANNLSEAVQPVVSSSSYNPTESSANCHLL
ncbi:testis-specific serine/threonine-protein kinase 6 [Pangasianodon hypophthalmus]|uniref:testis-specific serine/threonine-protein kinase 6 n=1 Tax=Pangasianodon hypophthalmus TaxID=310915 RepID=UPI00230801FB|nr:testis-specific serine/threonine-protein kinase 6 [Pangasianodon hypophthalmus]